MDGVARAAPGGIGQCIVCPERTAKLQYGKHGRHKDGCANGKLNKRRSTLI
jgi:hypothetical protein